MKASSNTTYSAVLYQYTSDELTSHSRFKTSVLEQRQLQIKITSTALEVWVSSLTPSDKMCSIFWWYAYNVV
jgi:hypothetical protein